jgi:PAS domain-containing protein
MPSGLHRTYDGSVHCLLGRAWFARDETGAPERLIGLNVDITERKRVHEALEESQKQLVLALEFRRPRFSTGM